MVKKLGYCLIVISCFAHAESIYRCEKDGKPVYQNWPCHQAPRVEQTAPKKPNHPEIVKCAMLSSAERLLLGNKKNNCNP